MIGHYVNNLRTEQEDAVLTEKLRPGNTLHNDGARCLAGAVASVGMASFPLIEWGHNPQTYMTARYDGLCRRFGAPRVNHAIRNRILSNRARRMLQNRPVTLGVGPAEEPQFTQMTCLSSRERVLVGRSRGTP